MISHRKVDTRDSRAVLGRLRTDPGQGKERNGQAKGKGQRDHHWFFFWRLRRFNGNGQGASYWLKAESEGGKRKQDQALECVALACLFVHRRDGIYYLVEYLGSLRTQARRTGLAKTKSVKMKTRIIS
jgi:hypothetical protein